MKRPLLYYTSGLWFVTLLGYGLHFKDTRRHRLFFSERNGCGPRALTVFGWRISLITPIVRPGTKRRARRFGKLLIGYAMIFALFFLCGYMQQYDANAEVEQIASKQWRQLYSRAEIMTGIPVTNRAGD